MCVWSIAREAHGNKIGAEKAETSHTGTTQKRRDKADKRREKGGTQREREKEKGRDGGRESKSEEQNRQGQVTPFPVAMR